MLCGSCSPGPVAEPPLCPRPAGVPEARAAGEGVHAPRVPPQDPAQGAGEEDAVQRPEHERLVTPDLREARGPATCGTGLWHAGDPGRGEGRCVPGRRGGAGSLRLLTRCLWLILTRAYKKIEEDDLKFPLIYGEGKKVKCCGRSCVGVASHLPSMTRGFPAHFCWCYHHSSATDSQVGMRWR